MIDMGKRRAKSKKANRPPQKPVVIEQLKITLSPPSKKGKSRNGSRIPVASLAISLITLLFGNGLLPRFINSPVTPLGNVSIVETDRITKRNLRDVYGSESYAVPRESRITKPLTVEIVRPANGSTFTVGDTVPIVARATAAEGAKVTSVSFYANGVRVSELDRPFVSTGEDSSYSSVWFPERGYKAESSPENLKLVVDCAVKAHTPKSRGSMFESSPSASAISYGSWQTQAAAFRKQAIPQTPHKRQTLVASLMQTT
jgi:hypothetical protein